MKCAVFGCRAAADGSAYLCAKHDALYDVSFERLRTEDADRFHTSFADFVRRIDAEERNGGKDGAIDITPKDIERAD